MRQTACRRPGSARRQPRIGGRAHQPRQIRQPLALAPTGIEIRRGKPGELVGVELAPARDRIDQVARNVPSPPIYVDVQEIPDPDRDGFGCLLVGVPASGPHMVDQRYWGRGDTGKAPLKDAEVREHLLRRRTTELDVLAEVRALERAFPLQLVEGTAGYERVWPRLFLRVVPIDGRADAMLGLLRETQGAARIKEHLALVATARPRATRATEAEASELAHAYHWSRYAHGQLLSLDGGPTDSELVLRIEREGAVDLVCGPLGFNKSRTWGGDAAPALHTERVLTLVHDVLGLVGRLAQTYAAYPGVWKVALRIDALEGLSDCRKFGGIAHHLDAYSGAADYEQATTTNTGELVDRPWAVTDRLLTPLIHALAAEGIYLPYEPGSTAAMFNS